MCLGGGGSWSNTELHYEDAGKRKQTNRKTKQKRAAGRFGFQSHCYACESLGCVFLFQIHHLYPITLTAHTGNLIY